MKSSTLIALEELGELPEQLLESWKENHRGSDPLQKAKRKMNARFASMLLTGFFLCLVIVMIGLASCGTFSGKTGGDEPQRPTLRIGQIG